jgi:hypothetical protein
MSKPITFEAAKAQVESDVYAAAILFEQWEDAGLLRGNGHHMAQHVAQEAVKLLRERWNNRAEVPPDGTVSPGTM